MINDLPDHVFVEIFSLCRMNEVGDDPYHKYAWKWHGLAHVCRTWRHIMFASSRYLRLELRCTHRTPVKKNLGYLPAFPIVISFLDFYFRDGDEENLIAALELRDRVRIVRVTLTDSPFEKLVTVMQEPFPALTHLQFESDKLGRSWILPDTFLGGSAPRLQTIYMAGISFPAAPTLLASACDLVEVNLHDIRRDGYISPEAMVTSLAALPKLKKLTFGFAWGMSHHGRIGLCPITRTVLPALTIFVFEGLFEYLEDFVAQIDAPQLDYLHIEYLDQDPGTDYQIPQLCKFIDRSEKLRSAHFWHADVLIEAYTAAMELFSRCESWFQLNIQDDAFAQVVNQLSAMLFNVERLIIHSGSDYEDEKLGFDIQWPEFLRPFTAVKALRVDDDVACHIPRTLKSVTGERVADVLPALELLCLENEPARSMKRMKNFIAARQNVGRPVTVVTQRREFEDLERLCLDVSE